MRLRILLDRTYGYTAQMWLQEGDLALARHHAEQGLEVSRADGYLFGQAFNLSLLGQVTILEGERAAGQALVLEALDGFLAIGARPEAARTHAVLASLGPEDDRAEHLARARSLFDELGMEAELARLGSRDPQPDPSV